MEKIHKCFFKKKYFEKMVFGHFKNVQFHLFGKKFFEKTRFFAIAAFTSQLRFSKNGGAAQLFLDIFSKDKNVRVFLETFRVFLETFGCFWRLFGCFWRLTINGVIPGDYHTSFTRFTSETCFYIFANTPIYFYIISLEIYSSIWQSLQYFNW